MADGAISGLHRSGGGSPRRTPVCRRKTQIRQRKARAVGGRGQELRQWQEFRAETGCAGVRERWAVKLAYGDVGEGGVGEFEERDGGRQWMHLRGMTAGALRAASR